MYLMLVFNYGAMPPFELDLQFICRRRLWRSSVDSAAQDVPPTHFLWLVLRVGWVEHNCL